MRPNQKQTGIAVSLDRRNFKERYLVRHLAELVSDLVEHLTPDLFNNQLGNLLALASQSHRCDIKGLTEPNQNSKDKIKGLTEDGLKQNQHQSAYQSQTKPEVDQRRKVDPNKLSVLAG